MSSSQTQDETPNTDWIPASRGDKVAEAYGKLQSLLLDAGYILADTMEPPVNKAVETKTAKSLLGIIDEFTDDFPKMLSDLIPAPQPKVQALGMRYIAPNVRLAMHLEQRLAVLRRQRKEKDAHELAVAKTQRDNEAAGLAAYAEAGRRIREERARAGGEGDDAPAPAFTIPSEVVHRTRVFQDSQIRDEAAREEEFWQLGGGKAVIMACLDMDNQPSQSSIGANESMSDILDDKNDQRSTRDSTVGVVSVDQSTTHVTPTKRSSDAADFGSPPKKLRLDRDVTVTSEVRTTSDVTDFRLSLASRMTRPWVRTDSDCTTSSTATDDTSTTVSSTSTALTTPTITLGSVDSAPSNTWQLRPALPDAERDALIIPPNPHQAELDRHDVPFYVQWEISRLIRRHPTVAWADVSHEDFDFFRQPDSASCVAAWLEGIAGRKAGVDGVKSKPIAAGAGTTARRRRMMLELQREDESIRKNDMRGVFNLDPDWSFGGKVAFVVTVTPAAVRSSDKIIMPNVTPADPSPFIDDGHNKAKNTLPFLMSLNPPDMPGKSFRLARRFGSRRVLQFRLKDFKSPSDKAKLMELFVGRRFLLFGRTYRALWAPSDRDSVFAIETPEGYHGKDPAMPTFSDILAMYNDMESKPHQAMAKWAARPQLLFSDSVPAVQIRPSAIGAAQDIVSSEATSYEGASTAQTLTDGCGLMSRTLAQRLRPNASGPPSCAVQVRLGGSKGMLAMMSDDQERQYAGMDVVLRDSMVKALPGHRFENDPSLLTIDVVRFDSLRIGTSLTSEAIVAMVHGGVPTDTLLRMGAESLNELKQSFLPEPLEGEVPEHVLIRLVNSCFRQGGVGLERKKRLFAAGGSSLRAAGLESDRKRLGDPVPDDEAGDLIDASEQYGVDPVNKQPGSLAESLMMALASGFHPKTSQYTCAKLHNLVATLSDTMIRKFRISVDRSITAFIIPDSLQILKPDEIFVSFSTRLPVDPDTQCHISHLEGPVLAFRSPCKLPTDVRKFTAVYRHELAYLKDCVVMSASSEFCARSPASYLGGGDYDGDTVQVFWEPALVAPFRNAPDELADVPEDFIEENFEKDVVKVSEFLERLDGAGADEEVRIANQQRYLLGAIEDDMATGNYSDLHGSAIYSLGLAHPETIRLAQMFCHVLDARKSGLKVKPDVKRRDDKKYGRQVQWRNWKKGIVDTRGALDCHRPSLMGNFILDTLMHASQKHRGEMLKSFPTEVPFSSSASTDYLDLSRLWSSVTDRLKEEEQSSALASSISSTPSPLARDVDFLAQHVRICYTLWKQIRASRLPRDGMMDIYRAHVAARHTGEAPPTPSRRSGASTPHRRGKRSPTGDNDALLRLTQMRHLAELWRDVPASRDVPSLCFFGDEDSLRRMKVSCGAEVEKTERKKGKQQLFVFDMDYEMACKIKAEATGSTTTVMEGVFMSMKTDYKRPGE